MPVVILLLWLVFLLPSSAISQVKKVTTFYDTKSQVVKEVYYVLRNNPKVLDSLYTSYFQSGGINVRGYYENNKANGPWEYYYQNGNLRMKGYLDNQVNTGFWTYFFENGNPSMEGEMEKGKKSGKWTFYYESGAKKSTGPYSNDKKEGLWNYFYEDGTFKAQSEFKNDKGTYKEFYPDGTVKSEGEIVDGKSNGLWKYFYEDGTVKAEGFEKDGLKEGMWKFYHPNGKVASEGVFQKGKSIGQWKYFHDNGTVSSVGEEIDGQKNGHWKLYYKNGSFKGEGEFKNGEGPYKEFYESGKLKINGYVKNNQNHGSWKYYYETGELEGECYFNCGKGHYTGYYPDKTIKMEGMIEDGNKVGMWKLYKEDGSLAGYYKTFYEDESPVFQPVSPEKLDSIKPDSILPYKKPEIKIPKKKSRYFTKRINEFQGFIVSTSPLGLVKGSVPISIEYYLQERLGHEVAFAYIKRPFFGKVPMFIKDARGFSVHLRQKYYQQDRERGMRYFGHEFRFSNIDHSVNFADTLEAPLTQFPNSQVKLKINEKLYEYSIIVGTRMMANAHKQGYSIDVFAGIGGGYRVINKDFQDLELYNSQFNKDGNKVRKDPFLLTARVGINFGYAINKKKLYKAMGYW